MTTRRFSAAVAALIAAAAAAAAPAAAEVGPTFYGRLAEPLPGGAVGATAVELVPWLGPYDRALVELGIASPPAAVATARPGPDGAFTLAAPGPGPWRLRVEGPGRQPQFQDLPPSFGPVELEPVPAVAAEGLPVTVLGPGGEPLAGARLAAGETVRFGWRSAAVPRAASRTGRAIATPPTGEPVRLRAWAPGFGVAEAVVAAGDGATVTLPAAAFRHLELRDAAGRPLAGAVVAFGDRPWPAGVSGEDGRVVAALPGGTGAVWIETGQGWGAAVELPSGCGGTGVGEVTAASVADAEPCRLALPAPDEVTGEMRDAVSGRALGRARAWPADDPSRAVATDGRGRFVLRFAPGGAAAVRLAAAAADHLDWTERRGAERAGPLLVELVPAMWVAGRVVDPEGVPLAGARVRLRPAAYRFASWAGPLHEDREALSGVDGGFRLLAVVAEPGHRLRAELAGYAPAHLTLGSDEAAGLEIVLAPGASLTGVVTGPAGEPVTGARVRLFVVERGTEVVYLALGDARGDAAVAAGEDGRFTLGDLSAGLYELVAEHPGFATRRQAGIEVPAEGTVDLGTVELAPGGALTGVVVDTHGEPVADAWLQAGTATTPASLIPAAVHVRGKSDREGRFALLGLPLADHLVLTATHPDYLASERSGLVLPLDEPLRIELQPGGRVFGWVLGADGEPLAGARVEASVEVVSGGSTGSSGVHAGTDADGGFAIGPIKVGSLTVIAVAPAHAPHEVGPFPVDAGSEVGPLEIRLVAGSGVAGRVLAPDGSPAPGSSVWVTPATGPRSSTFARSDARGEFIVDGVAPGPATVRAEHELLGDAEVRLDVRPGSNELTLVLESVGRLEGWVVDAGGERVPRAQVRLDAVSGVTRIEIADGRGRFLFRRLSPGDYRLAAVAPGLRQDGPPVPVTLGDGPTAEVELVLTAGEEIAGEVRGLAGGELAAVAITASCDGPRCFSQHSIPVGGGGRYRIDGLEPGRWLVIAHHRADGRSASGVVEVTAGGGPFRLDLEFADGLTLTGTVRAGGEPVAGAQLTLTSVERGVAALVATAADGAFRIAGLEPGGYRLEVREDSGPLLGQRQLDLTADDEVHLDFSTAALAGRLLDAGGEPVPGARVLLESPGGGRPAEMGGYGDLSGMTATDAHGRFEYPRLGAGTHRVSALAPGHPVAAAEVVLEAGERRLVELRLEEGDELVLVPALAGGGPASQVQLMVLAAGGIPAYVQEAAVAADGTAVFTGVPPGTWTIAVSARDSALVTIQATVPGLPVAVALPPRTVLAIEAPALAAAGLVPLVITGADGRPPAAVSLGLPARLIGGRAELRLLPPGVWTVRATAPDGRVLAGTAVTTPGAPTQLVLE